MIGLGTLINAAAILLGGAVGLAATKRISPFAQFYIKNLLAAATVILSFLMLWEGFKNTESIGDFFKRFLIMFVALIAGHAIGHRIGIQKQLNRLGRYAQERFSKSQKSGKKDVSEGFVTCALLFCVGPMAILGSLQDGISGDWKILAVKGAMDGLATMAFAATFGWGVLLSVIPVISYQGTLTLLSAWLAPNLSQPMVDSISSTGGMLIMCLPVIILERGKLPLSDWLPALAIAPFLAWLW